MILTRWRKILRDLWVHRKRVVLAVLSIAVGVFAIGAVSHMYLIVTQGMTASYQSAQPADINIITSDLFDQDLVDTIRRTPGVTAVEGWRTLNYWFRQENSDEWNALTLHMVADWEDIQVNRVYPEKEFGPDPGAWPRPEMWPPPYRQLVLERTSLLTANLGLGGAKQGDRIVIEMPSGKQRTLPLTGLAYDTGRAPAPFVLSVLGFIDQHTAEWLGEEPGFNELLIRVDVQPRDQATIAAFGNSLRDRVERSGHQVIIMTANQPGQHPLSDLFDPLALLMGLLGFLAIPLSAFLVINTVSAFITQQIRQIGVMKAVGATTLQISLLYLVMVLAFGVMALLVAVPLAALAAREFINFMAYFINFNLGPFYIPTPVLAAEVAIGVFVPLLAALHPILKGARTTVREAISSYGLSHSGRSGLLDRLVDRIHFLPRPTLLSLRNTFRRKARLALTLATLTLASAIFISVLSVRASLLRTLDELIQLWGFDAQVQLARDYRMERIENELANIAELASTEGWGLRGVTRIRPDGSETTDAIILYALPAGSQTIRPVLRSGRWLLPEDENALVVSPEFLKRYSDLSVGGTVRLKFAGQEGDWTIVGVMNMMDSGQMMLFSNHEYYAHLTNEQGRATVLMLTATRHDAATQTQVMQAVTDRFNQVGIKSTTAMTLAQQRDQNVLLFNILTLLLMAMALLLALVGGLGLTGLMSINVLERTREIGVMRAIGASNRSILGIFMTEGLLVGALAWLLGMVLSIPISRLLSDAVGSSMLGGALNFRYSFEGAGLWLVIVLLLAALSTSAPARDAARMTVRDVLAYE